MSQQINKIKAHISQAMQSMIGKPTNKNYIENLTVGILNSYLEKGDISGFKLKDINIDSMGNVNASLEIMPVFPINYMHTTINAHPYINVSVKNFRTHDIELIYTQYRCKICGQKFFPIEDDISPSGWESYTDTSCDEFKVQDILD